MSEEKKGNPPPWAVETGRSRSGVFTHVVSANDRHNNIASFIFPEDAERTVAAVNSPVRLDRLTRETIAQAIFDTGPAFYTTPNRGAADNILAALSRQ